MVLFDIILHHDKEFYIILRVRMEASEWFPVNVGFRQVFVMSPLLFNVLKDGVVCEVNARVLGEGLELLSVNGGWLIQRKNCVDW